MQQNKQQLYTIALAALGLTLSSGATAAVTPLVAKAKTPGAKAGRRVATLTQITEVKVTSEARGTRITLVGTQPFTPVIQSLGRPSATVITINGVWGAGRKGYTDIRQNGVWNVRSGVYTTRPRSQVRVVANTRAKLAFSSQGSADRTRWEIVLWAPGVSGTLETVPGDAIIRERIAAAPAVTATLSRSTALKSAALSAEVTPAPLPNMTTVKAAAAPSTLPSRGVPAFNASSSPASSAAVITAVAAPTPTTLGFSGASTEPSAQQASGPFPALLRTPVSVASAPVVPVAPVLSEAQQRSAGPAAVGVFQGDPTAKRVSIDVVAADINDVLKALSKQSGINIVTGNDVKGNITVSLNRVSLLEALDMVTRLSGYTYGRFGTAYVVGTPSSVNSLTATKTGPVQTSTEFITYQFNTPAALYRALTDRFPGLKLPPADEKDTGVRQRTLVITDTAERIAEIREFVGRLEQVSTLPAAGATTEIYRIKYASPTDLISILSRLVPTVNIQLGPGQGFIPTTTGGSVSFSSASPTSAGGGAATGTATQSPGNGGGPGGTNTTTAGLPTALIITGSAADIARAREVLAQIDLKTPQIVFEAQVIDVSEGDLIRYGFTYDFTRNVSVGEQNVRAPGGLPTVGSTFSDPAKKLNFGSILRSAYSIDVALDAIATNNKNRVLAKPNLSALDGQPAVVFIGDQIKYVSSIQQTQQGQTVTTETATVGITLKVTAKSSPADGTITLYVHPEVSTVSSFLNLGNGIALPQIATRFVDTTVRVKDGETIAIGGLIREVDIKNLQKVPFLGDLPILGQLFRQTNNQRQNSNVVVFITSRILKD